MTGAISRRRVLAGGGAGLGLVVAWALWPRRYPGNLAAGPGEHVLGAWLKIGEDGVVTLAVPQTEQGQGSWTALARVAADELGADWCQMAVEPAPPNPRFANPVGADALFEEMFDRVPDAIREAAYRRGVLMLTAGSSSVRAFEQPVREAAAAARELLVAAAARRWDAEAAECRTADGFVIGGERRLRFGELAADAADGTVPDPLPLRGPPPRAEPRPRLDAPPKVDGGARFANDIRLPDMVHARVRAGPVARGPNRLVRVDRAAAERVAGMRQVVQGDDWVAAVGVTGWAAERGLDALAPRFETEGEPADGATIERLLLEALDRPGRRIAGVGDTEDYRAARRVTAEYRAATGVHAAIETASATAVFRDGRLELWTPTEAPAATRAAAARAAGLSEDAVVLHPTLAGGGFGARLEPDVAVQAAVLAVTLKRPVALVWTRGEEMARGHHRTPAIARMAAHVAPDGRLLSLGAAMASAATGRGLAERLALAMLRPFSGSGDRYAVAGLAPPYRVPAWEVAHHEAELPLRTGHMRGGAHGLTCFFREAFLDEVAAAVGQEPLGWRISMLGGEPRLARCLSTAAALGGWDGGSPGSGQGIAAHAFRGSHVAVMAEARPGADGRPIVERLVAAIDCGRAIDPDLVRQQVEGGLIFGLGLALGADTEWERGRPTARGFDRLRLPRIADCPDITVELIESNEAPGGVSEIAVPVVAPAIAGALRTVTGRAWRTLPLG